MEFWRGQKQPQKTEQKHLKPNELTNITTKKTNNSIIFNHTYSFNHNTGNLTYRKDEMRNMTENFIYDNLNRLTTWNKNGTLIGAIDYAANGNIDNKENIGAYTYNSDKPHAVENIDINNIISQDEQNIAYNPFLKTASITQGNNSYTITYGSDAQRKKTVLSTNNSTVYTKIYSGLYEKEISGTTTKELHYIPTPCGTVAVHLKQGSTENTYFLLKDYLGSTLKVINSAGTTLEEHSYDPWGNHRNPSTWLLSDFTGSYRGYTGHEHLPDFQLINMNGRMYDPVIGRVLSPDNYVQDATNAQDYNRYSYARNNPLKYTDPDGEWIHIVIGAAIGGIMNLVTNAIQGNIDKGWKGFGQAMAYFHIGALAGAASAAIGAGVGSAIAGGSFGAGFIGSSASMASSATGFFAGAAVSGTAGTINCFTIGAGNSWMQGSSFGKGLWDGTKAGLIGGTIGAVTGGIGGGIKASWNGKNFWTGKKPFVYGKLDGYELISQVGDDECKTAVLNSIEKLNGGSRNYYDLLVEGDMFTRDFYYENGRNPLLGEYFEGLGFPTSDPSSLPIEQIATKLNNGHPIVFREKISTDMQHAITMTKIRQWTPKSSIKVWIADPARGRWSTTWNKLMGKIMDGFLF